MLRFLFPISLFLSAILLFSIQPMVAKALLPIYGGTPAVWTICMLFFQLVLLVSYGYAWLLSLFNKPLVWRFIHAGFALLSLTALPLLFKPYTVTGGPEWGILYHLLTQLGMPILVIGASAPLLQFAYSQTSGKNAADPYFLYAASNLGSLISLLIYPWIVERFIGLTYQFHIWTIGFIIYLGLLALVLLLPGYKPFAVTKKENSRLPWSDMAYWIFLSFIPCSLMLGVTLYITTDVAATPLFWVLPLALYLLSFILTFTTRPLITQNWLARNCIFFLVFTILGFILGVSQVKAWQIIVFNLSSFFVLALLCHGQLFQKRPPAQFLTLFYFCLAIGGVLAGIFNGILAPHWFNQVYEYPLAILLSVLILPFAKSTRGWWVPVLVFILLIAHYFIPPIHWFGLFTTLQIFAFLALVVIAVWQQNKTSLFLALLILFVFIYTPALQENQVILQERNFYGVKQVLKREGTHVLISQSTIHGLQLVNENKPLNGFRSYYGGVKPVVEAMERKFSAMPVTILGLGIGTMICQFRSTDHVTVVEIDQQVIDLAENSNLFTYLRDCPPVIDIIKNDGRLAVAELPDASQKLLILDAFNSDAIPVHLLTLEAFTLYKKKISEDGVILVNLSNRHLELLPVLNAIGRSLDLMTLYTVHQGDPKLGQFDSKWALLTANEDLAFAVMDKTGWRFLADSNQFLWTDDYSNVIPLLRWN